MDVSCSGNLNETVNGLEAKQEKAFFVRSDLISLNKRHLILHDTMIGEM